MTGVVLAPAQIEALRPLLQAPDRPRIVLIGATALSAHVPLDRKTYDVDLVFVAPASVYEPYLERHGWQRRSEPHRWCRETVFADVLPATDEVIRAGTVYFAGGSQMNTAGFDLILAHAQPMAIAHTALEIEVASLAALIILKIAAWLDRPYEREKDLDDLMHVLRRALPDDADCRWDAEHPVGASGVEFDFQSAYFVGLEVKHLAAAVHLEIIRRFMAATQDESSPCFGRMMMTYSAHGYAMERLTRATLLAFFGAVGF